MTDFEISVTRIDENPRQVGLLLCLPDGSNSLKRLEAEEASDLIERLQAGLKWLEEQT